MQTKKLTQEEREIKKESDKIKKYRALVGRTITLNGIKTKPRARIVDYQHHRLLKHRFLIKLSDFIGGDMWVNEKVLFKKV
jgi:hypothetical protein